MKSLIFSCIPQQYKVFVSYNGILIASATLYQVSRAIYALPHLFPPLIEVTPKILERNIVTYNDRMRQIGSLLVIYSFAIGIPCMFLYSFKELNLFVYEAGNHIYDDFKT